MVRLAEELAGGGGGHGRRPSLTARSIGSILTEYVMNPQRLLAALFAMYCSLGCKKSPPPLDESLPDTATLPSTPSTTAVVDTTPVLPAEQIPTVASAAPSSAPAASSIIADKKALQAAWDADCKKPLKEKEFNKKLCCPRSKTEAKFVSDCEFMVNWMQLPPEEQEARGRAAKRRWCDLKCPSWMNPEIWIGQELAWENSFPSQEGADRVKKLKAELEEWRTSHKKPADYPCPCSTETP